jgi:hypothetical protein
LSSRIEPRVPFLCGTGTKTVYILKELKPEVLHKSQPNNISFLMVKLEIRNSKKEAILEVLSHLK